MSKPKTREEYDGRLRNLNRHLQLTESKIMFRTHGKYQMLEEDLRRTSLLFFDGGEIGIYKKYPQGGQSIESKWVDNKRELVLTQKQTHVMTTERFTQKVMTKLSSKRYARVRYWRILCWQFWRETPLVSPRQHTM